MIHDDWSLFREAALVLLGGGNPYELALNRGGWLVRFYSPWWALVPVLPVALLPAWLGRLIMGFGYIGSLVWAGRRWSWGALGTAAAVLSTFSVVTVQEGQIEWLVLAGALLDGPVGFALMATKPQLGIGFMVLSIWRDWGNWRAVGMKLGLVAVLAVVQLVAFGLPAPLQLLDMHWNLAVLWWPASVVVGLAMLAVGIWRKREGLAGAAGAWLSPYLAFRSVLWGFLGVGKWGLVAVSVLSWVPVVFKLW